MSNSIELVVDEKALALVQQNPITANFAEVEAWLNKELAIYKNAVVTEDAISEAKATKAKINRLSKALSDQRIAVKRRYMEPCDAFEKQIKHLCAICDEASGNLDRQLKAYDEAKKAEKKAALEQFYAENVGEYGSMLPFESIFNPRWLNATYAVEQAQGDISTAINQFATGINVIRGMGSEFEASLIERYVSTRDLANVMALKKSLETLKADEERRKREAAEAKRAADESKKVNPPVGFESPQNKPLAPQYDPFASEEEDEQEAATEPIYTLRFEVSGTRDTLMALSAFMRQNGIKFTKI